MGNKLQLFGLLTIIIAILAGISLTWVLPQKQIAFAPAGDGDGGGNGTSVGGHPPSPYEPSSKQESSHHKQQLLHNE